MSSIILLLILSDIHGVWPYSPANPAPKADITIHCDDLTHIGGLASFKRAIEDIKTVDAPLKLVIAGNHDLEVDEQWVRNHMEDNEEEAHEEDVNESKKCIDFLKAQKERGIHYLEEGVHNFELKGGKTLKVYASPYTPKFNGYAFPYTEEEDRFNADANPIPAEVDIVITHGQPFLPENHNFTLDVNKDGLHCGCEKLADAIRRARPRLHCFGHWLRWTGKLVQRSTLVSWEKKARRSSWFACGTRR
ncbi:hypothetical protein EK21DRAFT_92686 [Setomelanomma holmii]|uniref:Calcineurin-like phosphoesterase domain-containing protein n=1 Tax=Setomelanomma holmii TaxID=210430 RepID=A0A9P4LIF4_9PLEO|nr:hypothetical protein EK21DRAFT_92686 [Setomelanomma holmii]